MNTKAFKGTSLLAALSVLAGCATKVGTEDNNAILSAEQVQAMIHVQVKVLEPMPVEEAVANLR